METQAEMESSASPRLEKLACGALMDVRKVNARAERLLRCLRGTSNLTGRDRLNDSDEESGWRLAA